MPRNSQGLYVLPSGNPVIPGTLIESGWANNTMSDVGDALTNSLPRNGVAPMTGPLILQTDPPTQPRHATSKAYVDSMLTYATGLPIGTVVTYAGSVVLSGFLLCNGQAVSRTTYADLFGTIGTIYGAGDGSNTFNLPDLQNQFIRGKGGSRTLGSVQAGMVGPHGHAVTDPIHTHGVITAAHTHAASSPAHGHTVTDPGHAHQVGFGIEGGGGTYIPEATISPADYQVNSSSAATGISVGSTSATVNVTAATQSVSIAGSASGVTVATSTGTENVPSNIALDFWIKAVQDVSGPVALTGIDTSDHEMISVDVTLPNSPMLVINSNVPYGTVKLDSNGKVPLANSQSGIQTFLGLWDASTGNNPSEENPFVVYANGDTFLIGVGGTIDLFDSATELESPTLVEVGDSIVRVSGSAEQPDGWYFIVATGAGVVASDVQFIPQGGVASTDVQAAIVEVQGNIPVNASEVPFTPAGTIAATNTQAAIAELDSETQTALGLKQDAVTAVAKTSVTGAAIMPVGTQAQRPSPATGHFRFNSDTVQFEGYNGLAWGAVGGGATGAPGNPFIYENDITVTANYTITANKNAMSAGPITIADGVAVTIPDGSTWSIV